GVGGFPLVIGQFGEILGNDLLACVIDQRIETAQLADSVFDQLGAKFLVPNITGQRDDFAAGVTNRIDNVLRVFFLDFKIVQCHIGTFTRKRDRHRRTNAGIRSGNKRFAAFKPSGPSVGFFAVISFRYNLRIKTRFGLILFWWADLAITIYWILKRQLVGHI